MSCRVRADIHVIGCTNMIENTSKGKQLGLNTVVGMGSMKGPRGTVGATRTIGTTEAANKTNKFL